MAKPNRPGGAEILPFRAPTRASTTQASSRTSTQLLDAPASTRHEACDIRDVVKALEVKRALDQREVTLLAEVDRFHTLVMGAAAIYGIDQVGFQMPNTVVRDPKTKVQNRFFELDDERGMSLVEGGFIIWGADRYEDPNKDPRIKDFHRMVNMRAPVILGSVDSLAERYPILRKICPNLIRNPGLMARLMGIRSHIVNNMPVLNIQNFDINIRASDPPEYETEIYNFMRVFEKGWDVKIPSQIDVVRGENVIDPERESVMRSDEFNAIEDRSYTMAVLRSLQSSTRREIVVSIRRTDMERVISTDNIEHSGEENLSRLPEHIKMTEYLKGKYNITIKAGNVVI